MATMKTKNVNNSPYSFLTFIYYQPKSSDETRTISVHVNVTNLTTRNIFAMLTMATTNSEKKITTRRKSSSNAYVFFFSLSRDIGSVDRHSKWQKEKENRIYSRQKIVFIHVNRMGEYGRSITSYKMMKSRAIQS